MITTEAAPQRAGHHVKPSASARRVQQATAERLHTFAAETLCDLGERRLAGQRERKPVTLRLAFAIGAMIGAAFGIYRH